MEWFTRPIAEKAEWSRRFRSGPKPTLVMTIEVLAIIALTILIAGSI